VYCYTTKTRRVKVESDKAIALSTGICPLGTLLVTCVSITGRTYAVEVPGT